MDIRLVRELAQLRASCAASGMDEQPMRELMERLESLTVLVAYQGFDLEATRRENATLRAALRKTRHRHH